MLDKIKTSILGFFIALSAVLGVLLYFSRNKEIVNAALKNHEETKKLVEKQDAQVKKNNVQLEAEEQKRKELENVSTDTSQDSVEDLVKFFTDRK